MHGYDVVIRRSEISIHGPDVVLNNARITEDAVQKQASDIWISHRLLRIQFTTKKYARARENSALGQEVLDVPPEVQRSCSGCSLVPQLALCQSQV